MELVQDTDAVFASCLLYPVCTIAVDHAKRDRFYVITAGNDAFLAFPELLSRSKAGMCYLAVQRPPLLPAFTVLPGHTVIGDAHLHFFTCSMLLPIPPLQFQPYPVVFFIEDLALYTSHAPLSLRKFRVPLHLPAPHLSQLLYDVPYTLGADAQAAVLRDRFRGRTVTALADQLSRCLAHFLCDLTDPFDPQVFIQQMYAPAPLGNAVVHVDVPPELDDAQSRLDARFLFPLAAVSFLLPALHQLLIPRLQHLPYHLPSKLHHQFVYLCY